MFQDINLNLLKYFYEVVNTKNITRASENMCVSQPAVTKALKDLEYETNTKLLERSKRGVVPTKEGEILYEHIKEIFINLESTLNTIEQSKIKGGNIYIGATTTNFTYFIEDAIRKFRLKYPEIHIDIVLETLNVLEDRKRLGKLDIVIKNEYEDINDFKAIKDFEIQDKFVASKQYFSRLQDKIMSLEDILKEPLVLLSNITHGRKNFDEYLKSKNISIKPAYEFNSYSLCRELIKDGFGIGICNPIHYKDNKDYFILNTDFDLPKRRFNIGYITTSKNKMIEEFIKIIMN